MGNNTSILDIRKSLFIEDPNYNNYLKLVEKIDKHKEIFDNKFFAEAIKRALFKKNIKGLLYISQLYVGLNRNVEAEFILFRTHGIDQTDKEVLYYLFDILCRRKQLGLVLVIGNKFDKTKDKLMYDKCLIKYFILTKRQNELEKLINSTFDEYKSDKEFVRLAYISSIQYDNYYFTYKISKTIYKDDLFRDLSEPLERRIKKHFYIMINNLLREKLHDNKNS
jgi:hypothetical protein